MNDSQNQTAENPDCRYSEMGFAAQLVSGRRKSFASWAMQVLSQPQSKGDWRSDTSRCGFSRKQCDPTSGSGREVKGNRICARGLIRKKLGFNAADLLGQATAIWEN